MQWNDAIDIHLSLNNLKLEELPFIIITMYDKEQREVAMFDSKFEKSKIEKGHFKVSISHNNLQLSKGIYSLSLNISKDRTKNPILRINSIILFQVCHERETWSPFLLDSTLKLN